MLTVTLDRPVEELTLTAYKDYSDWTSGNFYFWKPASSGSQYMGSFDTGKAPEQVLAVFRVTAPLGYLENYIRGWLNHYGIANLRVTMKHLDEWVRRRIRMYIWKQWKRPRTRIANLVKLGIPEWQSYRNGNTRKGYWSVAGSGILKTTITNERLASAGYYSILKRYESVHLYD